MMGYILPHIQQFIPMNVYQKKSEYEEHQFELIDCLTDELVGAYSVNNQGELLSFSLFEDVESGALTKDELVIIANKFLTIFHADKINDVELSAILDLDNPYLILYEKRDEKYGLFLHSTGFNITISTTGQIINFVYQDGEYEVKYDEIIVSEEEAISQYLQKLDFELVFQYFDAAVFKNGDNQYHLAYQVVEHVTEIPVNGSDVFSIKQSFDHILPILERKVVDKRLEEFIGFTSDYQMLDVDTIDNQRIEIWSKQDVDDFSFDMDEQDLHVVKLCFDQEKMLLKQITSGELSENGEEINQEKAKQIALDFMFKLFPDAHKRFKIEALEEDVRVEEPNSEEVSYDDEHLKEEEWEEKDNILFENELLEEFFEVEDYDRAIDFESTYTFYFHQYHQDVRVDQHVSIVGVGKYSGKIVYFKLDVESDELFQHLPTFPGISIEEATSVYQKFLDMEMMFVLEYDENGKGIYTLSFVPTFPQTIGHVRAIEAVNGEAMFVDVGDATFL